ncbi:hypothetical protein RHMOL_Rhmol04G0120900 [Rhododendron molle]|uniref:Uncharacterized protein n=1 Tax=Rhododendron molle TaxID=49168 RepID=A0ACC0NZV3_RHOML|nr:hypothetical protein RHMOL_Rhmol04G0120900 [Rhododendron molle]
MLKLWSWVCLILFCWVLGGELWVEGLGVNWGSKATHKLPPKVVVQMLKDNGIQKVKLFDAEESVLKALAGSGIEVMVAISNDQLADMTDYHRAKKWVQRNIIHYNFDGGVNIKYVAVGNEPFLKAYNSSFLNITFPALQNVQNALNEAGVGDSIKVTVPMNADVYESPEDNPVPSSGRFRTDITDQITQIVKFLDQHKAPFTVNIYPFLSLYYSEGQFPVNYAFFDGDATPLVDNGIQYANVFDANLDTLVSALNATGVANMTIFVGEVGWPTDGDQCANIEMASRFYNGLLPKLGKNKGTPLRPGYLEVYLFGLTDEDAKSILPGDFERHWGIFRYDGQPKFPMDLSGGSQEIKPLVAAQNVAYMPNKWCTLDPNSCELSKLAECVEYACNNGDCTSLGPGSSCGGLDEKGRAMYAFNMYYQMHDQDDLSCDFQGLAKVTTFNISQPNCNFTIQLVAPRSSSAAAAAMGRPFPLALAVLVVFFASLFL